MITCPECYKTPKIDVYTKDKTKCVIKCNCGRENLALIKDIVNSKSEYTNPNSSIPKCSRKKRHGSSIPNAEKFCDKCGYYFCKNCSEIHEMDHEDDDEPHILKSTNGIQISTCNYHKNIIERFCKTCQSELCSKCTGHEKHDIVFIYDIINNKKLEEIEHKIDKAKKVVNDIYKEIKDNTIKKITTEINTKISRLKLEIQENEYYLQNSIKTINSLYDTNVQINNDLIDFVEVLLNNYKKSSHNFHTSFNLINNTNFNFVVLNDYNLTDTTQFFKSNFIIDLKNNYKKIKCKRCNGLKKVDCFMEYIKSKQYYFN